MSQGLGQSPPAGDSDPAETAWSLFWARSPLCRTAPSGGFWRLRHTRSHTLEPVGCKQTIPMYEATSPQALAPSPVSPKGFSRTAGNHVAVIASAQKRTDIYYKYPPQRRVEKRIVLARSWKKGFSFFFQRSKG